jgi:hypothetical protein
VGKGYVGQRGYVMSHHPAYLPLPRLPSPHFSTYPLCSSSSVSSLSRWRSISSRMRLHQRTWGVRSSPWSMTWEEERGGGSSRKPGGQREEARRGGG